MHGAALDVPALADYLVKLALAAISIAPYGAIARRDAARAAAGLKARISPLRREGEFEQQGALESG